MIWDQWLPVLVVATSLIPGIAIFFLPEARHGWRTFFNLAGAGLKCAFVALMLWGVSRERVYEARYTLLPGIDFKLHADPLSLLLATLSAILWLLTTVYAIGYLEGSPNRSRFFGFSAFASARRWALLSPAICSHS